MGGGGDVWREKTFDQNSQQLLTTLLFIENEWSACLAFSSEKGSVFISTVHTDPGLFFLYLKLTRF